MYSTMFMYFTVLACVMVLLITLLILVYVKRKDPNLCICVCILTIVIEGLAFSYHPIDAAYYDTVCITAQNKHEEKAKDAKVFLKGLTILGDSIELPVLKEGQWYWYNDMYVWKSPDSTDINIITESMKIDIPVGDQRVLIFSGNSESGLVEITMKGYATTLNLYSEKTKDITVALPDSEGRLVLKNGIARIIKYLLAHLLILFFIIAAYRLFLKKLFSVIRNYKYGLVFFVFSLLEIVKYGYFPGSYNYGNCFYLNSYEFGFIKRGLIGEIVINTVPFLSAKEWAYIKLGILLLIYLLLSVLIERLVRIFEDDKMKWFFVLLICALPSTYMAVSDDMRLDVYMALLFVICTILIARDMFVWFVPILVSLIMLINETSCTYIIPPIIAMLLYKFVKEKKKIYISMAIVSTFLTCFFAAKFLFGTDPRLAYGITNIVSHIQYHTDLPVSKKVAISAEMWGLSKTMTDTAKYMAVHHETTAIFFCSIIPAVFLFGLLWKTAYRKWETKKPNKTRRMAFWGLCTSVLFTFIVMIIATDYTRYCAFLFITAVSTILFFVYEEKVQIRFDELRVNSTGSNAVNILPVLICIFYIFFGMYGGGPTNTPMILEINDFLSNLWR